MKDAGRRRSILHVDLDAFFVSVERSLDPSLRTSPVIVGGDARSQGTVVAASTEARAAGVRPGQPLRLARRACPEGVFRPGDLETYASVSEEVTGILLAASRRVERPSVDEAYVDLTPDGTGSPPPVGAAEGIKDQIHHRLGLDAALGLAGTRLAARVASSWARPRGLLVVLPGYETAFVARRPVHFLQELPPHLERALENAGMASLGQIATADPETVAAVVGPALALRLRQQIGGEADEPIAVAAPPAWVQEEARVRSRQPDRAALFSVVDGLVARACRRLRPFGLVAEAMAIEVRRADLRQRRDEGFRPGLGDEDTMKTVARALLQPLVEPAGTVRAIQIRLTRLVPATPQGWLFPHVTGLAR